MRQIRYILIIALFSKGSLFGQTKSSIDSLLIKLSATNKSDLISTLDEAKQIINFGDKVLPILAEFFNDTSSTEIYSDCQNLQLKKGEIAMIIADKIETMPYFQLTHIQNCLLDFCKDNPNLIEYYFDAIRRDDVNLFKDNYKEWLRSKERKKWGPYLANKNKKKE